MSKKEYKYIYGPVPSWRLGRSLGIDPISNENKICSFDCIYCQLGKTDFHTRRRRIFVSVADIIGELLSLPPIEVDYITFSGRGEPTLAANIGELISEVKKIRKEPVAIITNSSLLYSKNVRSDLSKADLVIAKLDAPLEQLFESINIPVRGVNLIKTVYYMKKFKEDYTGKFALQIMFMNENYKYAGEMARMAGDINPDEVQLNTPLRICAVKSLSSDKMDEIEGHFKGLNTVSVYNNIRKKVVPVSRKDTLKRRGKV